MNATVPLLDVKDLHVRFHTRTASCMRSVVCPSRSVASVLALSVNPGPENP